jgi:hypothetical protein
MLRPISATSQIGTRECLQVLHRNSKCPNANQSPA